MRKYLDERLGIPRSSNGQLRYNCPKCDKGNKYNLEICINEKLNKYLAFHCWSCHFKGHISSLLYEYATSNEWRALPEFKRKEHHVAVTEDEVVLALPKHTIEFHKSEIAYRYLMGERRMSAQFLRERNVLYVYSEWDEFYNKIIFPYYDDDNRLIAFTTHDLTTKKYRN
ncbi:MAG TPA: hypothetical protein VEC37_08960, partial [Bacillota bacterium]|nr:hypothetical protein [Bacillota bacterium]